MTTQEILEAARGAKAALALADGAARAQALHSMAAQLCSPDSMTAILAANADDMAAARPGGQGAEAGGASQRAGDRKDRRAHGCDCYHL